eukprot:gnl/MRDRNA2_/MRDRNA2_149542_c0_seq1.p1 gnl/MRDRNA2_/MRDRNA2_149542_c0~~gnl/MRDRNA2_/MRDRNA2_149542_c0_seq1.p1  ORF type:complete len:641 (+),score=139.69 gnl/MRDRNA2_/MRDRNA2_149542_c0_seq1:140-2062(+)
MSDDEEDFDDEEYQEEYQEAEESERASDGDDVVDDIRFGTAKRQSADQSAADSEERSTPRRVLVSQDEVQSPRNVDESWSSNGPRMRESCHATRIMAMLNNQEIVMDTTQKLERMSVFVEKTHEEHRAFVRAVYGDVLRRLRDEGYTPEVPTNFVPTDSERKQNISKKSPKSLRDIALVVQAGVHRVRTQARVAESLHKLQRPHRVRRILVDGMEVWMRRAGQDQENASIRNLSELISQMRAEVARIVMDRGATGDFTDIEDQMRGLMVACRRADELTDEIDEFLLGDFSESQDLKNVVERWAITMGELKIKLRKFTVSEAKLLSWDPFETMALRCAAAGDPGDVVLDLLAEFDPEAWRNNYAQRRSTFRGPPMTHSAQAPLQIPIMPHDARRSTAKRWSQVPETAQRYSVEERGSVAPHARESIPSKRMSMLGEQRLSAFQPEEPAKAPPPLPVLQDHGEPPQKERFFKPTRLLPRKFKQPTHQKRQEAEEHSASNPKPVTCTHLEGLEGFVHGDGDKAPVKLVLAEDVRNHLVEAWTEVLDSRLVLENLNNMPRGRLISAQRFAEQLAFRPIDLGPRRGRGPRRSPKGHDGHRDFGVGGDSPVSPQYLQRGLLDRKVSGTSEQASFFGQKMLHLATTM